VTVHHASSATSPAASQVISTVSCGYMDSDEPDDDGDEESTCITIAVTTTVASKTSSSSSSPYSSSSCDPSLDDTAALSCFRALQKSDLAYEASVVGSKGLTRRGVVAHVPAPTAIATPLPALDLVKRAEPLPRSASPAILSQTSIYSNQDSSLFLSWTDDGNLAIDLDTSRASFTMTSTGTVVGDSQNRLLHLYSDTLSSGISRLRLARLEHMPKGSVLVGLEPVPTGAGNETVLMAVTSDGKSFFPVTCVFEAQYPKVFLASDVGSMAALMSNGSVAGVTGDVPVECGPLGWRTG
jgi:hypothetical protein